MNFLRGGIDPRHRFGQLCIDLIVDHHRAEIRIFAVKAPFSRLASMMPDADASASTARLGGVLQLI